MPQLDLTAPPAVVGAPEPLLGGGLIPGTGTTLSKPPYDPSLTYSEKPPYDPSLTYSEKPPYDPTQTYQRAYTEDDFATADPLALVEDDDFRPALFLKDNPGLQFKEALNKKLLDVYKQKIQRDRGLSGLVRLGKSAVKNAGPTAATLVTGAKEYAKSLFGFVQASPLLNTTGQEQTDEEKAQFRKEGAKLVAASETSANNIYNLVRHGFRRFAETDPEHPTEFTEDYLSKRLHDDVTSLTSVEQAASGQGVVAERFGQNLDPVKVEAMSLMEPGQFLAFGVAGKLASVTGVPTVLAQGARVAGEALPGIVGGTVKAGGKAISGVAKATEKVAGAVEPFSEALGAGVGLVKSGSIGGAYVGAKAGAAIPKTVAKGAAGLNQVGKTVSDVGGQISGDIARSKGLQNLADIVTSKPVTGAVKGAATGAAVAAPLVYAADDPEAGGSLLGAGVLLGAGAGLVHGSYGAVTDAAVQRYFGEHGKVLPEVDSPGYGTEPSLDQVHESSLGKLPVRFQNLVKNFREATRGLGGEIYVTDEANFRQVIADEFQRSNGSPIDPAQLDRYVKSYGFFDPVRNGKRTVFLNGDSAALHHEAGHLFDALLSPDERTALRKSVQESMPAEKLAEAKARYEKRLGEPITDEAGLDEFIAEQFSALFNNVPITEMSAPPTLVGKFVDVIARGAETLGLEPVGNARTPDLQFPTSLALRDLFRDATRTVLDKTPPAGPATTPATPAPTPATPAVTPATPVTPAPTPVVPTPTTPSPTPTSAPAAPTPAPAGPKAPNIRTGTGQQNDFAAQRYEDIGTDKARAAAKTTEVKDRVDELASHLEGENPVLEIEHLGITAEEGKVTGRTNRRAEQEEGRARLEGNRANAPADIVSKYQKVLALTRFSVQAGKPIVEGMSLDKVISNAHKMAKMVPDGAGLPVEVKDGKLTKQGWDDTVKLVQDYAANQSNGFRGDGQRLIRPKTDVGISIPAENPDYAPVQLTPEQADYANLLMGLATPETVRTQPGMIPGNVKGQILAELNSRPTREPAGIRPAQKGKEFKGFEPRTLQEVNPLRDDLVKRGVKVRELEDVTEKLRVEDITNVKPRPDLQLKAPVTDTIRGGFLPEVSAEKVKILQDAYDRVTSEEQTVTPKIGAGSVREIYDRLTSEPNRPIDQSEAYPGRTFNEFETGAKESIAEGEYDLAKDFLDRAKEAADMEFNYGKKGAGIEDDATHSQIEKQHADELARIKNLKQQIAYDEAYFQDRTLSGRVWDKGGKLEEIPAVQNVEGTGYSSNQDLVEKNIWGTDYLKKGEPGDEKALTFHGTNPKIYPEEFAERKRQLFLLAAKIADSPNPFTLMKEIEKSAVGQPQLSTYTLGNYILRLEKIKNEIRLRDGYFGKRRPFSQMKRPDYDILPVAKVKAPVTDTIRGGFLPEKAPKEETTSQFLRRKRARAKSPVPDSFFIRPDGTMVRGEGWLLHEDLAAEEGSTVEGLIKKGYIRGVGDWDNNAGFFLDHDKPATKAQKAAIEDMAFATKREPLLDTKKGAKPYFGEPLFPEEGKFLPSSDPRAVKSAALRDAEGEIWEGSYHGAAIDNAMRANAPKIPDYFDPSWDVPYELGFSTNDGKFLTRDEAFQRGKEIGQIPKDEEPMEPNEPHTRDFKQHNAFGGEDHFRHSLEKNNTRFRYNDEEGRFLPNEPVEDVVDIGKVYTKTKGIPYAATRKYAEVDPALGRELADFYEEAKSDPSSPEVQNSYDELIKQTEEQGKAILDAGYNIEPWTKEGQPYKNSADMVKDVRDNKHLYYFKTEQGFGAGEDTTGHPMLRPSSEFPGQLANDVFRWVHEFFGHAKDGYQFGPRGEFNAWKSHSEMFTPEAQGALAAETLTQNSWVNYGRHLEGKNIPVPERPFAAQKALKVPEKLIEKARGKFLPARETEAEAIQRIQKTDYSKYNVTASDIKPKKKGGAKATSLPNSDGTGWILPNNKFESLDGGFHEQYLAKNADRLNQQYGTVFKDVPDVNERLLALDKGFVRIRHIPATGSMNIDASYKAWPRVKSKVKNLLIDREHQIDSLNVNLLNEQGDVVDSVQERVHDLDGVEKIDKMAEAVEGLRGRGRFLPENEGDFAGAVTGGDSVRGFKEPWIGRTHSQLGLPPRNRWRYEASTNRVYWSDGTPDADTVEAVDNWLAKRGVDPKSHNDIFQFPEIAKRSQGRLLPWEWTQKSIEEKIALKKAEDPEALVLEYKKGPDGKFIIKDGAPVKVDKDYPLFDSPLAKESAKGIRGDEAREAAYADALSKKLEDFYKEAVKNPDVKAGETWYSETRTKLKEVLGDDGKLFAELLGATSPQTAVGTNFKYSVEAYNQFKAGKYDAMLTKYREGKAKWAAGDIAEYVQDTGKKEPNKGQFMRWWFDKNELTPRMSNDKLFGMHSRNVLKVLDGSWLEDVKGPKTPNFMGNLVGSTFEATIDIWAARTLHRLSNEGNPNRWRIPTENETGISDKNFYFGQKVFRKAADAVGILPDALQAIVWFAEKQYRADKGWTRGEGAAKSDFNSLLRKTERVNDTLKMKPPKFKISADDLFARQ